jgi:hypothetical protein
MSSFAQISIFARAESDCITLCIHFVITASATNRGRLQLFVKSKDKFHWRIRFDIRQSSISIKYVR